MWKPYLWKILFEKSELSTKEKTLSFCCYKITTSCGLVCRSSVAIDGSFTETGNHLFRDFLGTFSWQFIN